MIKRFLLIFTSVFLLFGASACTSNTDQQEVNTSSSEEQKEVVEQKAEVIISEDDGHKVISEKEVTFEAGDNLLDVLKDHFDIETDSAGTFVTSIEGVQAEENEQKGWIYTVNEDMPNVGANDYELQDNDVIRFDFQAWE